MGVGDTYVGRFRRLDLGASVNLKFWGYCYVISTESDLIVRLTYGVNFNQNDGCEYSTSMVLVHTRVREMRVGAWL